MKIGFIGLGIMGKPMSLNILKAGLPLVVCSRTKAAVDELVAAGATAAPTPKEVAAQVDVVITMLPNSPEVKAVLLGANGVIEGARPGCIVADMSSIAPLASREIAASLAAKGIEMLDAPVSGDGVEPGKQLVLAVKTPVLVVFDVVRVVELEGGDQLVPEAAQAGILGGVALVSIGPLLIFKPEWLSF